MRGEWLKGSRGLARLCSLVPTHSTMTAPNVHELEGQGEHVRQTDEVLSRSSSLVDNAESYQYAKIHCEDNDCTGILGQNVAGVASVCTETAGGRVARTITACHVLC